MDKKIYDFFFYRSMLAIARCQYQIFKKDLHYMKFFTLSFFIHLQYKLIINQKKKQTKKRIIIQLL